MIRSVDSSSTLAEAYDAVLGTNEFYGVLPQQLGDVLHLVTTGSTAPLQPDDPATYRYQGAANLLLAVAAVTALAVAIAIAFESVLAAAFAWSLTLSMPLWLGMEHVDFKDVPAASGLTLVSAGLVLAFVLESPRRAALAGGLLGRSRGRGRGRDAAELDRAAPPARRRDARGRGGMGDRPPQDAHRRPARDRVRRGAGLRARADVGHEPDRAPRHGAVVRRLDPDRAQLPVGRRPDPHGRAEPAQHRPAVVVRAGVALGAAAAAHARGARGRSRRARGRARPRPAARRREDDRAARAARAAGDRAAGDDRRERGGALRRDPPRAVHDPRAARDPGDRARPARPHRRAAGEGRVAARRGGRRRGEPRRLDPLGAVRVRVRQPDRRPRTRSTARGNSTTGA